MMNASHEEVDKHHEKALEYFTKPDHELKHRKRIDVSVLERDLVHTTTARTNSNL